MNSNYVVIYGALGALGKKCLETFKIHNYKVISIDLGVNNDADINVIIDGSKGLIEQSNHIEMTLDHLKKEGILFDAILCVAGGWAGGNASDPKLAENTFSLEKQCIWPSIISASIASKLLKEDGCLVLTGAKVALTGTPTMLGYGMCKAAVHQLTRSLAEKNSGLPKDSWVGAILPVTLDTEANRKWMSSGDFSTWTSLEFVAELMLKWTSEKATRPRNGALIELVTKDYVTTLSETL